MSEDGLSKVKNWIDKTLRSSLRNVQYRHFVTGRNIGDEVPFFIPAKPVQSNWQSLTIQGGKKKAKKSINYDLPDLDRFLEGRGRKFVTYQEGSDLYGIPYYSFVRLAKEAGANITLREQERWLSSMLEAGMKDG